MLPSIQSLIRPFGLALLASSSLLTFASPISAQIETAPAPTATVKAHLTAGRFSEALVEATALRAANPADFEAAYYVAMAQLGLGNHDAALIAAQQAQKLAPSESLAAADMLISTINAQRGSSGGSGTLAEAEVALADGLTGKAARLYDQAWAGGRGDPDAALKAAGLYADRLGQFADAGRLLNEVARAFPESPAATKAKAEYAKHAAAMANARSILVKRAWAESWPTAEKTLLAASGIEPANIGLHWIRLAKAAEAGDTAGSRRAIVDLAKLGPINLVSLVVLPGMAGLIRDAEFSQFLMDVLGAGRHATLTASVNQSPAVDTIANLVGQRAISVSIRSGCDAARSYCTFSANYPIVAITGPNKCEPKYTFGNPTKNQFSDVLSTYSFTLDDVNGLSLYAPGPYRSKFLVELNLQSDPSNTYSRGFLVENEQIGRALERQLHALRISCGNLTWSQDIITKFQTATAQNVQSR